MKVELLYGKATIAAAVPPGCHEMVIRKQPRAPLRDPRSAIAEVLARPIGAPALADYARGKRSACILICDITRPVPNHLFLRPMIEDLLDAGIPRAASPCWWRPDYTVPIKARSSAELVGDPWVLKRSRSSTITRATMRPRRSRPHRGARAPVKLDRRFVEAGLRIATGLVEPHFMAGYSGGRKVVAPGVAHANTIRTFHSARFMENPLAIQCNLAGNPLHEEQLEIVRMLGRRHALNTVIDEARDLVFVSFGEIIESHLAAVGFVAATSASPDARAASRPSSPPPPAIRSTRPTTRRSRAW